MGTEYGVKIKNFQAGAVYQCNIGVRQNYDYTKAMINNSLFLDFLKENGLKIDKMGWTRDIICMEFDYGSRSYEEEINHINKMLENPNNKYNDEQLSFFNSLKQSAELNKDLFNKKSAEEIRYIFYENGVEIRHDIERDNGKVIKEEYIHYQMLYRSTGKAKSGSCMFICDRLYNKAIKFLRMGLKIPKTNAPIVEMGAYSSLVASSICGKIKINPRDILILKDVDSFFTTDVVSVETNENKECIVLDKKDYNVKNTMFDGQGLIDSSVFPSWGEGYVLLRHHMCKMACFKTNIQLFFKDYFGDNYETAVVHDMFGNEHKAKDIKIITTDNAMKFIKFKDLGATYDFWCEKVFENGCNFGIVKTAHKSKLGEVQKMSYQMINTLDYDIMPQVVEKSCEYIESLKMDNNAFLRYLKDNENFSNDYKVLIALCEQDNDFFRSDYFRNRKKHIIEGYVNNFKFGKVIQDADNLVFVGSPYAMLLHSVGESVDNDDTFSHEDGTIQCYTQRFSDGEYLACFRSPHNSRNNIAYLHNVYSDKMSRYFDFGKQILAFNTNHTDIQDRLNGCDMDSDSGYTTNQPQIVECARKYYKEYHTIVNNIAKNTNAYENTIHNYALIDNKLANSQASIGESSNLAQFAQTYMHTFGDKKYIDYVCILSVLAQVCIDSAKRTFDVDTVSEIARIKKDLDIQQNGYPIFWKHVKDKQCKIGDKKFDINKINKDLICPMNYLMSLKFKKFRNADTTLPTTNFLKKYELNCREVVATKVEKLIEKYSIELYMNSNDEEGSFFLKEDFDKLIEDIKAIYISNKYIGLSYWLIYNAFYGKNKITEKNKSVLLKTLYDVNKNHVLKIFSQNLEQKNEDFS